MLSGRKAEALEALAAELPGDGHRVLPADLAEPGAAEQLAAEAGDVDSSSPTPAFRAPAG